LCLEIKNSKVLNLKKKQIILDYYIRLVLGPGRSL